jgi:HlyD family secretion protein
MKPYIFLLISLLFFNTCEKPTERADAYGNFEAAETIVSSQGNGIIERLDLEEGEELKKAQSVGQINAKQLQIRIAQLQANIHAVTSKTPDVAAQLAYFEQQIAVSNQQLDNFQQEKKRSTGLVQNNAAPQKQLDDINNQIAIVNRQIDLIKQQRAAQLSALSTQKNGLLAEVAPLQKQIELLEEQIKESEIINPLDGTVTLKLAEANEVATYGKPLYKIANLSSIIMRAYVSGSQLSKVKIGQKVTVNVDAPEGKYLDYPGTVIWIANKAEFTPKVIQTKEERVNLVYALKISVPNDGKLKIGMPGEVKF